MQIGNKLVEMVMSQANDSIAPKSKYYFFIEIGNISVTSGQWLIFY